MKKNPVLPLKEYVSFLKDKIQRVSDDIANGPSPEDLKMKSTEAVVGTKAKRVVALKDAVDIITEQSYNKGKLDVLNELLSTAEQTLMMYNEVTSGNQ